MGAAERRPRPLVAAPAAPARPARSSRRAAAPAWTEANKAAFVAWVRDCADRLGLRDWVIRVEFTPLDADSDAIAEISPVYGQRLAQLQLSAGFAGRSPTFQRDTIAHELVHCHLADLVEVAAKVGEAQLTKSAGEAAWAGFWLAVEHAADAIGLVVADLLDPPSYPDPVPVCDVDAGLWDAVPGSAAPRTGY